MILSKKQLAILRIFVRSYLGDMTDVARYSTHWRLAQIQMGNGRILCDLVLRDRFCWHNERIFQCTELYCLIVTVRPQYFSFSRALGSPALSLVTVLLIFWSRLRLFSFASFATKILLDFRVKFTNRTRFDSQHRKRRSDNCFG